MEYSVKIDAFEGPLDLLLHLINRYEIDIYDIPVAKITEQYMSYVHTMQELQLDVASEYLVMAATLLAIKSKMLLPKEEELEELEEDFDEEDPRDELMQRLLQYRRFKEVAKDFEERDIERGYVFTRPPQDLQSMEIEAQESRELSVSMYDILSAVQKLLKRKKIQKPLKTRIARQEIQIEDRMTDILKDLRTTWKKTSFFELFPVPEREHIVVTFLAVLELLKQNQIIVEQKGNFDELLVSASQGGEAGEE